MTITIYDIFDIKKKLLSYFVTINFEARGIPVMRFSQTGKSRGDLLAPVPGIPEIMLYFPNKIGNVETTIFHVFKH